MIVVSCGTAARRVKRAKSEAHRGKTMKINFVNEIPQWIISSNVAAYHPESKTIWIRNDLGWKTFPILIHELTHWFIHKYLGNSEKLHNKLDGRV